MDARVLLPKGYDPATEALPGALPVPRLARPGARLARAGRRRADRRRPAADRRDGRRRPGQLVLRLVRHRGRARRRRRRTGRASTWTSWSRTSTRPSARSPTPPAASSRASRRAATARSSTPPQNPGLFGAAGRVLGRRRHHDQLPGLPGREPGRLAGHARPGERAARPLHVGRLRRPAGRLARQQPDLPGREPARARTSTWRRATATRASSTTRARASTSSSGRPTR